jgi:predicted nucleotidyltransferase component of viral defense system
MAPNPSRSTAAGRVFNDLRNMARREGRSTDELMVLYVLERFLYRVSLSSYRDKLVLKGGLLLAILDARRSTRDVDLLAVRLDREVRNVVAVVTQIASIEVDDGIVFDVGSARPEAIRGEDIYGGVRVVVPALLGKARVKLSLDVNFGDPVTPGAVRTLFPQLFGEPAFPLLCYPLETVLAEKVTTMLSLGDLNTRDRDWADVWRLTGIHELSGSRVEAALIETATYRAIRMRPLSEVISRLPRLRQSAYMDWRSRQSVEAGVYPESFDVVVRSVVEFADPVLDGTVSERTWTPNNRQWAVR